MEKQEIARIEKSIKRCMAGCWEYVGGKFYKMERVKIMDISITVELTSDARKLQAAILTKWNYGIEDAENTFEGETLIQDCAAWITERFSEVYETVEKRASPYRSGYEKYQRVLRGEE